MQTLRGDGPFEQVVRHQGTESPFNGAAPNSNFWRHASWSPDGSCVLAAQDDSQLQTLRLPDIALESQREQAPAYAGSAFTGKASTSPTATALPPLKRIAATPQTESLYACAWYPGFHREDAQTACFAASCRGQPVHLWDALEGTQRGTYRTYDQNDEVATAFCIAFHPDGERCAPSVMQQPPRCCLSSPCLAESIALKCVPATNRIMSAPFAHLKARTLDSALQKRAAGRSLKRRLMAGLKDKIVLWHLSRPGRGHSTISTKAAGGAQKGIISAIATPVMGDLIAAGSFNKTVGLYDARQHDMQMLLSGHTGGVTHVQFSRCDAFCCLSCLLDVCCLPCDVACECAAGCMHVTQHPNVTE
jgi:WD40 repeat protein